jgi:hypothetical protein
MIARSSQSEKDDKNMPALSKIMFAGLIEISIKLFMSD